MLFWDADYISLTSEEFRVRIYVDSYSGSPVPVRLAAPGFTLTYDASGLDLLSPIIASKCTIPLLILPPEESAADSFLQYIANSAETDFWVTIERRPAPNTTWTLFWYGYVLQDFYTIDDATAGYVLTLSASDNLGRLKSIDYSSSNQPYGLISCLSHILNCLNSDGLSAKVINTTETFLITSVNWVDANIGYSVSKCPLAHSFVFGSLFAKEKSTKDNTVKYDFKSCYEVLSDILEHWGARIYLSNGRYRIEQIAERAKDNFVERRFTRTGSFISSGLVTADFVVSGQTFTSGARLSGGAFGYFPALRYAAAIYAHSGTDNYLENANKYWFRNSPYSAVPISFSNIILSNNTLKISGQILVSAVLSGVYTQPWRIRIRMRVIVGNRSLSGQSLNLIVNGNPTTNLVPPKMEWLSGSNEFYEISTAFCFTDTLYEVVQFSIETPKITHVSGVTTASIQFEYGDALDMFTNPVTLDNSLLYWEVMSPDMRISGDNSVSTIEEGKVVYKAVNPLTNNSDFREKEFYFGHHVVDWNRNTLWTNTLTTPTTQTWGFGAPGGLAFNQLWAQEAIALQRVPRPYYSGTLFKKEIRFHNRIIFSDSSAWLFITATFVSHDGTWKCELVRAGADREGVVLPPPAPWPPNELPTFEMRRPGGILPDAGAPAFDGAANLAIVALTTNHINTTIGPGSVSSLPLRYAVNALDYVQGDDIMVVNPTNGDVIPFEVAQTSADGDTTLQVLTKTIPRIPAGALLLYGPLNKYTKQGGSHSDIPKGVAQGQILRWNNTAKRWEVFSGSANGHVLTWNTTNGWQSSAPGSGGVQGSGLANYIAVWVASDQITYYPPLYYDPTNGRLGVGTQTPAARVHAFFGTLSGTFTGVQTSGTITGTIRNVLENNANVSSANSVQEIRVNSHSSGDPYILFNVANDTYWSIGVRNSDADKLRIVTGTAPTGTSGVTITRDSLARVGINTISPTQELDVNDGVRANRFIMKNNPPTITPQSGMGTNPTGISVVGGINGFFISFTTGTAPAANANIFQATYAVSFPSYALVTFAPYNVNAASEITKFYIGTAGNVSFMFRANGTLQSNTTYSFAFTINGY
ncbi:MAG: hypothetical protein ABIK73_07670 [candidate division WOR-3 bacterium]